MTHHKHPRMTEMLECTDLGSGVCLREWRNDKGELVRFVIAHERPGHDTRCEGSIPVNPARSPHWTVEGSLAEGNLTLSPSVLEPPDEFCPGQHGWVRNGKWEVA